MHSTQPRRRWRTVCLTSAVAAGLGSMLVLAADAPKTAVATAKPVDTSTVPLPSTTQPTTQRVVIPKIVMPGTGLDGPAPVPLLLGDVREYPSAGIAIAPPVGFYGIVRPGMEEEIVRFVDDVKKPEWTLTISRRTFPEPQHLLGRKNAKGQFEPGIVENTLTALVGAETKGGTRDGGQFPGAKVLRGGDPTNIGSKDVGMIVIRYAENGERRLAQHAIIEAHDQMYYLVALNTPARKDVLEDKSTEEQSVDPAEQQAVETFRNILDRVQLLDLAAIKQDQDERLMATRAMYRFLTERKLNSVLVPERYLRVTQNGQDIGYSYVVEQQLTKAQREGISVGVRSRGMQLGPDGKRTAFPRQDAEVTMFASVDREVEDWGRVTVWDDDGKPKSVENPWRKVVEFGATVKERKAVPAIKPAAGNPLDPNFQPGPRPDQRGDNFDPNNPWIDFRESYRLNVQMRSGKADLEPLNRRLPPFYLPQAMTGMIHRLVDPSEQKKYLFATYVPELRQVVMRYIDVGPEQDLPPELAKQSPHARGVPVTERVTYEGLPTVHYVTKSSEYIGSVTPKTGVVVVPVTEEHLRHIWNLPAEDKTAKLFEIPPDAEVGAGGDAMNKVTSQTRPATPPPGRFPPRRPRQ